MACGGRDRTSSATSDTNNSGTKAREAVKAGRAVVSTKHVRQGFGDVGAPEPNGFVLALLHESDRDPEDHEAIAYFQDVVAATQRGGSKTHQSVHSVSKRLIDIVGALVGLALMGVLLVPIALLIKLDSRGPVFFRQTRCGLNGQLFQIWKFRSMTSDASHRRGDVRVSPAPGYENKSLQVDSRVTRVGRILRASSLDEVPQFLNVLLGQMSLVGTRPPTPFEVANYSPWDWRRLHVKTGMSGLWQVSGRSSVFDFADVVQLDLEYQERWSTWLDIKILAQTLPAVLRRSGAC